MLEGNQGSNCAICNELIDNENDSKEHVIIEAIGGRLVVTGFICKCCNNETGRTWDAKLASQLHPLSLIFGVERHRGSTPTLAITTTAGEKLTIRPEGGFVPSKPSFSEELTHDGIKIQITARSIDEAKRMLAGIKRKYPNTDVDRILAEARVLSEYPKGMVHHQIELGGELSGRSIVKSALALAYRTGISVNACSDAVDYLRIPSGVPCFGYYYATDLVSDRPVEVPLHCVGVEANPDTGLILGYAEYFGVQRIVVCLGRNYKGDRVQGCYAIDPRSGEQLGLSISLSFNEAEISAIYEYKMIPDGAVQEAFAKVMPTALKKQFHAERDRVIGEATEYAFANCGAKPGEVLTGEHITRLSGLVMEKLTPFILHNLAHRRAASPHRVDEN